MSLRVKVNGATSFEIAKECVQKTKFRTDIPLDSNLEISGKILVSTDGDPFDSTLQLGKWSMVPAEDAAAYRQVEVEIINAGVVERKYTFPRAFVVDYKEDYANSDGIGQFSIVIKQKKDKLASVSIEGGYIGA